MPIISHDENLSRVAGVDCYVAEVDFDELGKSALMEKRYLLLRKF